MKLKLDENLGLRGLELLSNAGHDVCTVPAQDLCSATDEEVAARCRDDGRGIVTLDLDFANSFRFPPAQYHGIAVLRGPARMGEDALHHLLITFIGALKNILSRVLFGSWKREGCGSLNRLFDLPAKQEVLSFAVSPPVWINRAATTGGSRGQARS